MTQDELNNADITAVARVDGDAVVESIEKLIEALVEFSAQLIALEARVAALEGKRRKKTRSDWRCY